jgi:hypothetical protein
MTGMPRQVVASLGSMRRDRLVLIPLIRRSVGGGDLRHRLGTLQRAEQITGGSSAQHRPLAAREDRREEASLHVGSPVPHPVDPSVLGEQGAAADARPDLIGCDPSG